MKKKAHGERGSWFATVDGERLPCVHRHWISGSKHCDPEAADDGKWIAFIDAIKTGGKVVVTKDDVADDPWVRIGYLATFKVDNVVVDDDGLKFDLVERIDELK